MNELQAKIYQIIIGMVSIENFASLYEESADVRYGFMNYVAKYSLAKDIYLCTEKAFQHIKQKDLFEESKLLRNRKSGNKFTYEHPIPSKLISKEIVKNRIDHDLVKKILTWTDRIVIITEEEDSMLRKCKLISNMPIGWRFFEGNIFARYHVAGIMDNDFREVTMKGAISR